MQLNGKAVLFLPPRIKGTASLVVAGVDHANFAQQCKFIWFDDPNHDHHHHRRAIQLLARGALRQGDHAKVVAYLQDMYAIEADLQVGIMLLSAYHGLNDQQQVDKLLTDLQQRFGYDDAYFSNLDSNSPNK